MATQNASLQDFLHHCGLDTAQTDDSEVFNLMRQEAADGVERIRGAEEEAYPDASSTTRLAWEDFRETAVVAEVWRIYDLAHPRTKRIYNLAQGDNHDNWIIRWLLQREASEPASTQVNHR